MTEEKIQLAIHVEVDDLPRQFPQPTSLRGVLVIIPTPKVTHGI